MKLLRELYAIEHGGLQYATVILKIYFKSCLIRMRRLLNYTFILLVLCLARLGIIEK